MDDLHVCVLADKSQLQRQAWVGFCFLCCVCWKRRAARGRIFLAGIWERKEAGKATALRVRTGPNGLNEISGCRYCNWSLPSRQGRTGLLWCVRAQIQALPISAGEERVLLCCWWIPCPASCKQAVLWNLPGLCLSFHSENIAPKGRGSGLDKIRLDLSVCPELKPNVCLPEFLAFHKAQIISLATCPPSSMSALYGSTQKHSFIMRQTMYAASELLRSRNLKTCQQAHSQISSPIFTDTEQDVCHLSLSSFPSFQSLYFLYLICTFKCSWGSLVLPTRKVVNSSRVQPWGNFTFCLTIYPLSWSSNCEPWT